MDNVRYILSNIRGHWAEFRPEDPQAPGYPVTSGSRHPVNSVAWAREAMDTIKVGFSGDWTRHFQEEKRIDKYLVPEGGLSREAKQALVSDQDNVVVEYRSKPKKHTITTERQVNERDFAPGRDGKTALWLESKQPLEFGKNDAGKPSGWDWSTTVKIHAGCPLEDFVKLIKAGGGDVWQNGAVLEARGFGHLIKDLAEVNKQIGRHERNDCTNGLT
jgi:hypothetical protein